MIRSKREILFLLIALAAGISFPYLMEMARHELDTQTTTAASLPLGEQKTLRRLESACTAIRQLNRKLDRRDPDQPSSLAELKQLQKVRPELQQVNRLVCGR